MAYCPLLPGHCRNATDCGGCSTFSDVLHPYADELFWVCPDCLTPRREPSGFTLLGHYQEIDCDICSKLSNLCQAALPPDVLTAAKWFEMLQRILEKATEENEDG